MDKKLPVFIIIILTIIILGFSALRYNIETSAINNLKVKVKDVQIQDLKITSTKLKLNIEITNPTSEDIFQFSTDFNIFIASSFVGKGSLHLTDIPAQTVKETSTNIIIFFADVANAVINAITSQNFNLMIQGTLHTKVLFGLISVSQDFSSVYSYS